jgi:hypothetical protein
VAIKDNLLKDIGDIKVYKDFKILEVKVLIIFFSIIGFSLYKDRR